MIQDEDSVKWILSSENQNNKKSVKSPQAIQNPFSAVGVLTRKFLRFKKDIEN